MKANLIIPLSVVLMSIFVYEPLQANAGKISQHSANNQINDLEGPGKKGKKKTKRIQKSKHKKLKRRFCAYCPPARIFDKGQFDVSFGIGVVPTYLMDKATILLPPLTVGADYLLNGKFSIGIAAGHSISESRPIETPEGIFAQWTNSHYNVGIKPGIHFTIKDNWDIYGGFQVGVNYSKLTGKTDFQQISVREIESHMGIHENTYSPSFFGYTGVRYVISPKWTIKSEVGFGISLLNLGCTYLIGKGKEKEEVRSKVQL